MTAIDTRGPAATGPRAGTIPRVDVRVDGTPIAEELLRRLVSVRIAHQLSRPTQCELAFATWRGTAAEYDAIALGARIDVAVAGPNPTTVPGFDGEVTALDVVYGPGGETLLRVRAYDVLHRLRGRQQFRVFDDLTVADLTQELTGDLGLRLVAEDPGPRRDRIVTRGQSDLDLLTEVTGRAGRYVVVHDDEICLLSLAGTGEPVRLELGTSLLEAHLGVNATGVHHRVRALGWHAQRAEFLDEPATAPRGGPDVGVDLTSTDTAPEWTAVDLTGRNADELAAFAQSRLDASAGRTVTLRGVAEGDTSLRAGTRVDVAGVAASLQGTYVLTEAIHTVDATGFRTTISTEPPASTPATAPATAGAAGPGGSSVTLGRVSEVADPDGLGRVRVSLPAYGDVDAGWLAVTCPGAGPGKGLVALPDVGDTVLVALPHGGPADGIVIGSVFGQVAPPDAGIVDGAVRRWSLSTPSGHSILLDDDQRRLRIDDSTGNLVELGPDLLRLHAQTDLVIEAPGRTLTIRAAAVDFVHAPEPEAPPGREGSAGVRGPGGTLAEQEVPG
ncbi:phage baseplate assembly protein V [Actinopolymorpha pittospori]|uniref:Uncharacterized protein involved in type VI secretion and phage assembly n=1 Tax=Actinopolymorpha pittospori TaxID=648752 RepID=A0A927MPY5_9ACTN|nr:phage baseplate assembly protein V [Actinopolymorpha pittospori]MBE1604524.1 uncharacterized protein involved in type VI secretion and phage assembly [Actinopolymorpha pittospori]